MLECKAIVSPLCILSTEHCRASSLPGRRKIVAIVITQARKHAVSSWVPVPGRRNVGEGRGSREQRSGRVGMELGLKLPLGGISCLLLNSRSFSDCYVVAENVNGLLLLSVLPDFETNIPRMRSASPVPRGQAGSTTQTHVTHCPSSPV